MLSVDDIEHRSSNNRPFDGIGTNVIIRFEGFDESSYIVFREPDHDVDVPREP